LISGRVPLGGGTTTATAAKTYVVEDAEKGSNPRAARHALPWYAVGLAGRARRRAALAAGTSKVVVIVAGKQRQIIGRFEGAAMPAGHQSRDFVKKSSLRNEWISADVTQ
jgi:hypothetical protein